MPTAGAAMSQLMDNRPDGLLTKKEHEAGACTLARDALKPFWSLLGEVHS